MTKKLVAVVFSCLLSSTVALAQDDVSKKLIDALEQIQTLKDQVAELKEANLVLANEKAALQKEIEQLKTGGTKKGPSKSPALGDILVVGAVFTAKSEHIGGPGRGATTTGTITITARDGDTFTATNTWVDDQTKLNGTSEIKGTIIGTNRAKWKRVDGPIPNETKATLRPDGLYIDVLFQNAKGVVIKAVWKI